MRRRQQTSEPVPMIVQDAPAPKADDPPQPDAMSEAPPPEPPHVAEPADSEEGIGPSIPAPAFRHLSVSIRLEHWIPLLVVLATVLLATAALAVGLRLLSAVHHTVLLFALGGLAAYALDPVVEWVRGTYRPGRVRRCPRWLGVVTVFAALFAITTAGVFALGEETSMQVQYLSENRDALQATARDRVGQADTWLAERGIPVRLADVLDHPPASVTRWEQSAARGSFTAVAAASRSVFEGVIVLLIAVYLLIYNEEISAGTVRALPDRVQSYAVAWRTDVNRILGGFVRGQLILAITMGAFAAAACALLGLKLWLLIGFFVVIVSLLPVIGPYIGTIPAIASALATPAHGFLNPLTRSIAVVILFVLINEAGSKVLYPRLVGKALGLHEIVVLMALLAGLEIGGITGVLFAAPVTALTIVTVAQLWRLWHGQPARSLSAVARAEGPLRADEGTP